MRENRQLGHIVEDHKCEEHYEHDKGRLVDALLHVEADIVAQNSLDHEQQNQASVENGERQQVQNAEIQADRRGRIKLRKPALGFGRLASHARNPDGAGKLADMNLVREQAPQHFYNVGGVGEAEVFGLHGRPCQRERIVAQRGGDGLETQFPIGVELGRRGLQRDPLAIAESNQLHGLALLDLHVRQQGRNGVKHVAVDGLDLIAGA